MELTIVEFMSIGIVGAALSLVVEYVKTKYAAEKTTVNILVVVGSILLGLGIWALQANAVLYQTVVGVLAAATTVYGIVLKNLPKDREDI